LTYNTDDFTYGVELEYSDCYRFAKLPNGAKWNDKDNTIVNSNGIANDPKGLLYDKGGEINTMPTSSIDEQIKHIEDIHNSLDQYNVNYRSNLHIHVRVPKLHKSLDDCKKLLTYIDKYQQEAFDIVETIPIPVKKDEEVYKWEMKRYKRRKVSHQYKLPKKRVEAILNTENTTDFFEEHAPLTEKGRMWFFSPRAGINLRQMWEETNTIEFRHFAGTTDLSEIKSCLLWCKEFLNAALNTDESPTQIKNSQSFSFPDFGKYCYKKEQLYQYTNHDKNNKKVIFDRIQILKNYVNLNTASVDEVFEAYKKIEGML